MTVVEDLGDGCWLRPGGTPRRDPPRRSFRRDRKGDVPRLAGRRPPSGCPADGGLGADSELRASTGQRRRLLVWALKAEDVGLTAGVPDRRIDGALHVRTIIEIVDYDDFAVGPLDRAGISEVATGTVATEQERLAP